MSSSRGIFGLDEFYNEQTSNKWSTGGWVESSKVNYQSLANHYGYFGGGKGAGSPWDNYSTIDRIDYSNDTAIASIKGSLSETTTALAAVGNQNYGYFGGGQVPDSSSTSKIDRLDYANDTVGAPARGQLDQPLASLQAVGNNDYGYFTGGTKDSGMPAYTSVIQRLDYSNDTGGTAPKGATSLQNRRRLTATGNANYGYFGGGYNDSPPGPSEKYTTVDRLDYSNDTAGAPARGKLDVEVYFAAASGNSNFGYFGGGGPGPKSTVQRLDYSNDDADALSKGPLADFPGTGVSQHAAVGNSNFGYFGGGSDNTDEVSKVCRIDYSNDTAIASIKGPLTIAKSAFSATSSTSNALPKQYDSVPHTSGAFSTQPIGTDYGYFGGGEDANDDSANSVDRLDFTNDTANAVTKGSLNVTASARAATGNINYGWFIGGYNDQNPTPATRITTVDRLDYSNDTATASMRGNLSSERSGMAAGGNENYGYIAGGYYGGPVSKIDRIDYSNDIEGTLLLGNLISERWGLAAVCNQSYTWFAGGDSNVVSDRESKIYRLDYSNDTVGPPFKGYLTYESRMLAAAGNANYGYFAGGDFPTFSNVDRIDYSNDTAGVSKGDLLPGPVERITGTGNANYGYFAGGTDQPGANIYSTIRRLDYSNDTSPMETKGTLQSGGKSLTGGVSSRANALPTTRTAQRELLEGLLIPIGSDFAYWNCQTNSSQIDRMDYSNDTVMTTHRSSNSLGEVQDSGSVSSLNYGYWGGGTITAPTADYRVSLVQRLDYANDTANTVPSGLLTLGREYLTAAGNVNYGYFATGKSGGPHSEVSTVDRVNYANDTAQMLSRGTIGSDGFQHMSGVGNNDYGYFSGGYQYLQSPDYGTKVYRIDYSNDSANASNKGGLNYIEIGHQGGTGNANYGYLAGGKHDAGTGLQYISDIQRLDYSNDEQDFVKKGKLTNEMTVGSATGDQNYGYFGGGSPGPNPVSTVQRIDYANDNVNITTRGPLSVSTLLWSATSSRENALPTTKILLEPYTFGEATARIVYPYGYFAGGVSPGSVLYSLVQRIDYSNDSANALNRGPLTSSRYILAAAGNKNYGYFGGGYIGSSTYVSTVDRIDYANDNTLSIAKGSLLNGVGENAAVGTNNYGYWLGGTTPSAYRSDINRLDYANDNSDMIQRSKIENDRWGKGMSMGTNNYGYFAGGMQEPSTTDSSRIYRLDYANDTADASLRSSLVINKLHSEGTGNKDYGYIMGGWTDGIGKVSSTDRFNYSNDTAGTIFRGPLTALKYWHGATGSQNFGYVAGGQDTTDVRSLIERLNYSNDTAIASTKGSLYTTQIYLDNSGVSAQENQFASLSKLPTNTFSAHTYGYFAGGDLDPSPTRISTVDRIDYTNDTANAVTKGPLAVAKTEIGGLSSRTYGYIAGGDTGSVIATIDRIDYANDSSTVNTTIGPEIVNVSKRVGTLANVNYGYIAGGEKPTPIYSDIYRLDFSNDSNALLNRNPAATTGTADIKWFASVGNKDYGYFAGGVTPGPTLKKTVFKFDYSNDAVAVSPKGDLAKEIKEGAAIGNNYFGYVVGGIDTSPNYSSSIQRIDYSNDTVIAQLTSNLTKAQSNLAATGNHSYGYVGGGYGSGGIFTSIIDRIDYSNDTADAITKGKLSKSVRNNCAFGARQNGIHGDQFIVLNAIGNNTQNSPAVYGYFGAGNGPANGGSTTVVQRIDYSNDTETASVRGGLITHRRYLGATGNQSYGYFGGGTGAAVTSVIERIDYYNDSTNAVSKGSLSAVKYFVSATGNANFGYFAGGDSPQNSDVDRIDYSNDTAGAPARALLSSNRFGTASVGNQNFGYFGSGHPSPNGYTVERMDYSSDTTTSIVGNLPHNVYGRAATGNKDYGYFAGGTPGFISDIDRIDYSNDLAIATPKGTLTVITAPTDGKLAVAAATGNKDYGYFAGGYIGSYTAITSVIQRIDYSNDTGTIIKGPLSAISYGQGACSAGANGLPQ